MIDLAHSNPRTFQDSLEHTKGPIIISHGNTKSLCNHIRNYTDDQIRQVANRGGVIGICGIKSFIGDTPETQTVNRMVDHIEHVIKIAGIESVGLGLDVCYYLRDINGTNGVSGFETIADTVNIVAELKRRGYSENEIQMILFDNFVRVIKNIME